MLGSPANVAQSSLYPSTWTLWGQCKSASEIFSHVFLCILLLQNFFFKGHAGQVYTTLFSEKNEPLEWNWMTPSVFCWHFYIFTIRLTGVLVGWIIFSALGRIGMLKIVPELFKSASAVHCVCVAKHAKPTRTIRKCEFRSTGIMTSSHLIIKQPLILHGVIM